MSWYLILYPTMQDQFKSLKKYMKEVEKTKKRLDEIEEQMEELYWTEEDPETYTRLYQELKSLESYWKMGKLTVRYCKQKLLEEANLTG